MAHQVAGACVGPRTEPYIVGGSGCAAVVRCHPHTVLARSCIFTLRRTPLCSNPAWAHDATSSECFGFYPEVHYVAISQAQARQETMAKLRTIHHGIDLRLYPVVKNKQQYLSFIGRIAPITGTHIAIDVAQRTGIPLKIAGQVQPINREYFEK